VKTKLIAGSVLLCLSGAAWSATLAHGVDAHFIEEKGILELKVSNVGNLTPVRVSRVSVLLPVGAREKQSQVAFQTVSVVEVPPGAERDVRLLPVTQLVAAMDKHGDLATGEYSRVVVANAPGECEPCKALKSYGVKSVGFGAQTVVEVDAKQSTTSLFGGYLDFVSQ